MLTVDKIVSVIQYKTLIQPTLYLKCCKSVWLHKCLSLQNE